MANEAAFRELHNIFLENTIEDLTKVHGYKSIQKVEVFSKQIKLKWFIFPYKDFVTVVKFTIDESLFVMESLVGDMDLRNVVPDTYEIDIEYT